LASLEAGKAASHELQALASLLVSDRSHAIPTLAVVSWPGRIRALLDVPEQIKSGLGLIVPKLRLPNNAGARHTGSLQNQLEDNRYVSR
jgi:hypothetical protein